MRRKEKEITDRHQMEEILHKSLVCRLALCDFNGNPYVVPLSFGYEDGKVYFHSARAGRKVDMLRENPKVCMVFDVDQKPVTGETACDWGMHFKSVIAFGTATLLEGADEKKQGLDVIMSKYAGSGGPWEYKDKGLEATLLIRVDIQETTGKVSGPL